MLTHHHPEHNPGLSLSAAAKHFPDVELAAELSVIDLSSTSGPAEETD